MRVLIIYALAGIGHKKAAEAICSAFGSPEPSASPRGEPRAQNEVILTDALDHTNRLFRWLYPRLYLCLVLYIPHLWGFFYYLFDNSAGRIFNCVGTRQLKRYIHKLSPDVIISTHFLPAGAAASLKETGEINSRLITVITDLYPHYYWISSKTDIYVVGVEEAKSKLIKRGIDKERIRVFGIPVDMKFSRKKDIPSPIFRILVTGGGCGIGPIEKMVKEIIVQSIKYNAQGAIKTTVVCGSNQRLYNRLTLFSKNSKFMLKIFGFVNNMDDIMDESDLVITKPGGVTVFEALAKGLPILAVYPIPGQESENAKLLTKYGAAIEVKNMRLFNELIVKLINRGFRLSSQYRLMKEQIKIMAKPNAAEEIVRLVYER